MTVTDSSPGPSSPDPESAVPAPADGPFPGRGACLCDGEPPAGLGPWVPPLPRPEPQLSARMLTWLGAVALVLIIAAAAAVAVVIGSATSTADSPDLDALYLGSVRDNSGLRAVDVSDAVLVDTGHSVCGTLDERPSMLGVVTEMRALARSFGWNDDDVAAVVGSAIGAYCPRHVGVVSS